MVVVTMDIGNLVLGMEVLSSPTAAMMAEDYFFLVQTMVKMGVLSKVTPRLDQTAAIMGQMCATSMALALQETPMESLELIAVTMARSHVIPTVTRVMEQLELILATAEMSHVILTVLLVLRA